MAIQGVKPKVASVSGASRFQKVTAQGSKRLVLSVAAEEKGGKNHFAFTAPGPIGLLSMDTGIEGMVEKFIRGGQQIYKCEYALTIQPNEADPATVAVAADKVWGRLVEDYRDSIRSYQTTVCDTGTEMWELIRLARFGKIGQVMPHHYGPVNREYQELIREVYETEHNLILLHKMKDEWENDAAGKGKKTGRKEIKQQNDVPFIVQANIQSHHDGNKFHITFLDCRQNMDLVGLTLDQPDNTFEDVAQMVFEGEWEGGGFKL